MIFQLTKNIPNILSSIRIIITIPFIFSLYDLILGTGSIISLLLFSIIIISDILDGYLARKLNFVSAFGANLDIFVRYFLFIFIYNYFMLFECCSNLVFIHCYF